MEVMLTATEENKLDMEHDKFDSYEFDRNEFGNGQSQGVLGGLPEVCIANVLNSSKLFYSSSTASNVAKPRTGCSWTSTITLYYIFEVELEPLGSPDSVRSVF